MGAFVAFVAFGRRRSAGLRAFVHAFARQRVRSLARAPFLLLII